MNDIIYLNSDTESVKYLRSIDPKFNMAYELIGDFSYIVHDDNPFLFLLDTIVGQMLSNKVKKILADRVHVLCNGDISPETILKIKYEDFRKIGISHSKTTYIYELANAVKSGVLDFDKLKEMNEIESYNRITSIRGLGAWSAKMYQIFVLNKPDILPYEDGAFLQSYRWAYGEEKTKKKQIIEDCKIWKPYSSIAARYYYKILDAGYTKNDIHSYEVAKQ